MSILGDGVCRYGGDYNDYISNMSFKIKYTKGNSRDGKYCGNINNIFRCDGASDLVMLPKDTGFCLKIKDESLTDGQLPYVTLNNDKALVFGDSAENCAIFKYDTTMRRKDGGDMEYSQLQLASNDVDNYCKIEKNNGKKASFL